MYFFVVFGASGDLASRKTFPAILSLIKERHLQASNVTIVGYSRTALSQSQFLSKFNLDTFSFPAETLSILKQNIHYFTGSYNSADDFHKLTAYLVSSLNADLSTDQCICYLALPPTVYNEITLCIQRSLSSFYNLKLVIEKPFGTDSATSLLLSNHLASLFDENIIFRIDHYLGKEMVKNIYTLRFCNHFFTSIWNSCNISNIQITFKESFGVLNRGSYFDSAGIVRDVMQNHLLQILSIIAMEPPVSFHPDDIRCEKIKLLKCIQRPVLENHCVFGQYNGYFSETDVAENSQTPTFAAVVLFVQNERWNGIPFILKCGKFLNESKAEIRIQLKDTPASARYFSSTEEIVRNELVIRVQPQEAIYLKLNMKKPGTFDLRSEIAELDLTYATRFRNSRIPEAYESLILDVVNGDHSSFVGKDELKEAWEIADSIIHNSSLSSPIPYLPGSRGPEEADIMIQNVGQYLRPNREYFWPKL